MMPRAACSWRSRLEFRYERFMLTEGGSEPLTDPMPAPSRRQLLANAAIATSRVGSCHRKPPIIYDQVGCREAQEH